MLAKFLAVKRAIQAGALLVLCTAGAATMHADEVRFSGTATGAFNGAAPSSTASFSTLTYYGSSFDQTTFGGAQSFGGNATTNPATNFNNFGSFFLNSGAATFGETFTLMLAFTNPTGVNGGQNSSFFATVTGMVSAGGNGSTTIAFNPSSSTYAFNNGSQVGSFTIKLNDVDIKAGQLISLSGKITETSRAVPVTANAPEPMSLTLLGTGLLSVAGAAYRKRKASLPLDGAAV